MTQSGMPTHSRRGCQCEFKCDYSTNTNTDGAIPCQHADRQRRHSAKNQSENESEE